MAYRLYRSDTGVLIRTDAGEIELSAEDAAQLGAQLTPPTPTTQKPPRQRWTPELRERVRSLYVDAGLGAAAISREIDRTQIAIRAEIRRLGLLPHDETQSRRATAMHASRRAA